MVRQLSVFLENTRGKLAEMTGILGSSGIDMVALSVADTANFGVMRMLVTDEAKAVQTLKHYGYTVSVTQVIACSVDNKPGGLAVVLKCLDANNINVEYLYSFFRRGESAVIIFRTEQPENTEKILNAAGIKTLGHEEVLNLA